MSFHGQGGPVDHRESAMALEKACEAGDAESCMYLSRMCHHGDGIAPDEARARSLLARACQLGLAQACVALKQLDLKGEK